VLRLRLDARGEALRTKVQEDRLAQAVSRLVDGPVRLEIEVSHEEADTLARKAERQEKERLARARQSLESDPTVKALKDRFGAVIQPDSIKPVG
jgi:DNA polymerase-3 subunit gamma/tau